jgi:hypothetical protein
MMEHNQCDMNKKRNAEIPKNNFQIKNKKKSEYIKYQLDT